MVVANDFAPVRQFVVVGVGIIVKAPLLDQ